MGWLAERPRIFLLIWWLGAVVFWVAAARFAAKANGPLDKGLAALWALMALAWTIRAIRDRAIRDRRARQ